jgi:hypothetical protein
VEWTGGTSYRGFAGEVSRNIDIRIRDPAKSEIPIEDEGKLKGQLATCIGVLVYRASGVRELSCLASRVAEIVIGEVPIVR